MKLNQNIFRIQKETLRFSRNKMKAKNFFVTLHFLI